MVQKYKDAIWVTNGNIPLHELTIIYWMALEEAIHKEWRIYERVFYTGDLSKGPLSFIPLSKN
jgi:uncharacterized membrane protein YsdA (DUF1294 family)